jgi:hypothetical protein
MTCKIIELEHTGDQQEKTTLGLWPRLGFGPPPRWPEPRQQQDWILMCLQGGRNHPLTAWGGDTLLLSSKVRRGSAGHLGMPLAPPTASRDHLSCCREHTGGEGTSPPALQSGTQKLTS